MNLNSVVQKNNQIESELPAKLKRLLGSANIPANLDHKKEIGDILRSKYSR